jgi:hypothetical protein
MVRLNKTDYLPPLRLVEDNMTDEVLRETLDYAFGKRHTVKDIRKRGEFTVVYCSHHFLGRPMSEWDKFYENLDEHGSLWIDFTKKLPPNDYHTWEQWTVYNYNHPIEYSVEKKEGHWEIQYAKKEGPRISTTSETPRYTPPPLRRSARFTKPEPRTVIPRTVSIDLPVAITIPIPDAKSVCIATVVSIIKTPKRKWYSCLFPKLF